MGKARLLTEKRVGVPAATGAREAMRGEHPLAIRDRRPERRNNSQARFRLNF